MTNTSTRFALAVVLLTVGCASEGAPEGADTTEQHATAAGDAIVRFTSDFKTVLEGTPRAGKAITVEYALDRLPACRGNVGGGGPGWVITGYVSENGGAPKAFDVSKVNDTNDDRVSIPVRLPLAHGGDVAFWFQVSNRWGCSAFDSFYGQNYHLHVDGPAPDTDASIVFGPSGEPTTTGELHASGRVKVRFDQSRLRTCVRTQAGNPLWTITGFASIDGAEPLTFDTARAEGPVRKAIDAIVELPHAGELALWFQATSVGGCSEYDSRSGANYKFRIDP